MTFSIVGFDPHTKELGIAVASKFLCVGAVVPFAKAGVGAIATQSWANLNYGIDGLDMLQSGMSPEEVLKELVVNDEKSGARQVGIVDAVGRSVTFTGEDCFEWAGGHSGENFAIQGNILVNQETVDAMKSVFLQQDGPLEERLLAALYAGDIAGGDSRGKQSAALLVVKENGSYGEYTDRYIDLRVDDHTDPVKELGRLLKLHQLYFSGTAPEDIVSIDGVLADEIQNMLYENGFLDRDLTEKDDLLDAIQSYHLIENFDERVQERGFIDKKVVEYMRINK
ncbi:DUF1028 domain-containing protein [Psychrobacillus psychrodurans]|uniref:DUF1028 domain-containing protein n=1 Tax=Psychrobacillus TaxID=1221880 RepID=UPI0008EB534E|nr:DUF1028 domain-containing protein [Psychrobacillus psychrodurans]MCK1996864.1 DUF1028 domain-containing protein [Psychrobacillus psychrodurans]MCZ8538809.1 DUF1028 domain-containing protein [Psychrobacillus psychrodurans]SFM22362.1 Uncharacterized conserved protein, Ntn-hydrolase superfamily [Psychrobacillus psychrodurans]